MIKQIDTTLFRVVVHARNEFPAIDDAGINVEPNTATDIALKQVKSKTLLSSCKLRILLKQNTALLSYVCPSVTGVTSQVFSII